MKHYKYDVWPYFAWNNTKEAAALNRKGEKTISVPIDKHPEAMMRYREYKMLLGGDRGRIDTVPGYERMEKSPASGFQAPKIGIKATENKAKMPFYQIFFSVETVGTDWHQNSREGQF
jgi:hypothetical protein